MTFKHLLVPLDGSHLAEAALPPAISLAHLLQAPVTLVHVIERHAPEEVHGERHLTDSDEARTYLEEVAARFPPDIHVESHVHTSEVSDVARSIVEHVGELDSDLIVMCTHGRGGLRSWLFGSIAQQVLSLGTSPVLLVQPDKSDITSPFKCRRLLIPLDGDPEHEQGLPVAASLAQVCQAALHLLMVIPTRDTLSGERASTARLLPSTMSALLDMTEQGAEEYLQRHVKQLQAAGLPVTASVRRGAPAVVIARTAQETETDLIVLGTHGKAGMDAFWSGSVTPQVFSRARLPLLLVRVHKSGPDPDPGPQNPA
jgi:nucleotide-binding universal stress UspA family protein